MGPANYNYSYVVGKSCTLGPQGDRWWNGYEDSIFQQHVLQFIEESTPSDPLFIFWAPHIVHTPLQVPEEYFRMFDFVEATDKATHERQIYHAMVHFADAVSWRCFAAHSVSLTLESVTTDWQAVGNVTTKLKQEGFWDDTVVVFSTDKCASHPHSCVPCCLL